MFGLLSKIPIKTITYGVIVVVILGALWYISSLKADLAVSESNTKALKGAIKQQQMVIQAKEENLRDIRNINGDLSNTIRQQNTSIQNLYNRFNYKANGQKQNIGKIAFEKPGLVQHVINKATAKVIRCSELATGAPLKKGETNSECPDLVKNNHN